MSWGSNFIILLDSDEKGKSATIQYIDALGEYMKNRIVTYENILNKKIVTEDLFTESDAKLLITTAFEKKTFESVKSDKKKFKSTLNFAISQLLVSNTQVSLDPITVDIFKLLFAGLENSLKNTTPNN
jgi:hypothetical protein